MRTMKMACRHRGCHRRVIPAPLGHTGNGQPRSLGSRAPLHLVGRHTPADTVHIYIPRLHSPATIHSRGRAEGTHARTARPDEHDRRATAASSRTARTQFACVHGETLTDGSITQFYNIFLTVANVLITKCKGLMGPKRLLRVPRAHFTFLLRTWTACEFPLSLVVGLVGRNFFSFFAAKIERIIFG
jgi:hypothetical protein